MPDEVIDSGKNRGSRSAATSAARYPATNACEDSASIDCAREMRGTSSIASAVSPASRSARTRSSSCAVGRNEIVIPPGARRRACDGASGWTDSAAPAPSSASAATVAPAAT